MQVFYKPPFRECFLIINQIYGANTDKIKSPEYIYAGQILFILEQLKIEKKERLKAKFEKWISL